jgi:drug/metabolite transporter (DMT)-like permease
VAVLLGWALAGEPVGPSTLVSGLFIVAGIILILSSHGR